MEFHKGFEYKNFQDKNNGLEFFPHYYLVLKILYNNEVDDEITLLRFIM